MFERVMTAIMFLFAIVLHAVIFWEIIETLSK